MDTNEDSRIPIISGITFLAIACVIIDVKRENITFEVGDETIEFLLSHFMKNSSINDLCCFVDIIDECIKELSSEPSPTEELDACPT